MAIKKLLLIGALFLLISSTFANEDLSSDSEIPPPPENGELPPDFDTFHEETEPIDDSDVLVLTDATFDDAIKENKFIMVEFYAPWCGHCKQLAPQYARAAKALKSRDEPIPLAKVDATAELKLAERYEIQGYPSLKFFINGEPIEYTGGRTDLEIMVWIDKKTGPILKEVSSVEDLEKLTAANEVVIVLFGDAVDSEATTTFKKLAYAYEDLVFILALPESLRTHYNVENVNSVVLFKKFDEGRNDCNCEVNEDNVKNFIDRHQFPIVMNFNERTAEKIFGEGIPTLFLFLGAKDVETSKLARDVFAQAAETIKGKILLCISSFAEELGQRLAEYIGLTDDDTPSFKIINPNSETGEVKKYAYEGEFVATGIIDFFNNYNEGKLKPYYRSEAIPETNEEPVKVVVGKSFNDIVLDTTKDVLIEFYAPWCGHCKQLAPTYEAVAKRLSGNSNVVLAKVDATVNEIEGVAIEGFPTLKFYPANDKSAPIDFDGERTEDGLIEFIKAHASLPWVEAAAKEEL